MTQPGDSFRVLPGNSLARPAKGRKRQVEREGRAEEGLLTVFMLRVRALRVRVLAGFPLPWH